MYDPLRGPYLFHLFSVVKPGDVASYQNTDQAVKKLQDPLALTGPWTIWQSFGLMNSAHTAQVSLVALS
jgi:hypothetical protein